jgi:hypothetical protein
VHAISLHYWLGFFITGIYRPLNHSGHMPGGF